MKKLMPQMFPAALVARALVPNLSACAGLLLGALIGSPQTGFAQAPTKSDNTGNAKVQLLFVQNGTGVTFDTAKGTLRLKNVAPSTLFFSDRPVRLAGHVHTKSEFLPMWGESADSFVKDPPNATVSILEPGKPDLANIVVTLMKPRMEGNDLVYDVTVIEGTPPRTGGATAVFIDVLGFWRRNLTRVAVVSAVSTSTAQANAATQASTAAAQASAAAAQASAAAANAATKATPAPTVIVQTTPAKPALTPTEEKLAQLKSLLNQGFITQAQYQQASQKVINEMVQ